MLVIRPVVMNDLDDVYRLSELAGSGMTSMPADREALAENIANAESSFTANETSHSDYFLLVMEDTEAGKVVGTSAVHARTGTRQAFYAYRLMSVTHYSHSLEKEIRSGLLHLTNEYTDCSEVGTLFLDPQYRGNGHWLSRSRYLLMSQHQDRFASHVIAELRGYLDEAGNSPVWDAIGQQFFDMTYQEADRLCGLASNQFITELMPKYPIYTNLLPPSARAVLGKPHKDTERAMNLLLDEGFEYENLIDVFDGGPLVRCRIDKLRSVQQVQDLTVEISQAELPDNATKVMLSSGSLASMKIVYQMASVQDDVAIISKETAATLDLNTDDQVMILTGERS